LTPWQIRVATEMLGEDRDDVLRLQTLSAAVGLSEFHFCRAFKKSLGVAPYRYRTQVRMERARRLLSRGDASITDIALTCGYQSSQAFARVFAREVEVTPTAWRRERRG
jgi:AraC family transcriptional regulator